MTIPRSHAGAGAGAGAGADDGAGAAEVAAAAETEVAAAAEAAQVDARALAYDSVNGRFHPGLSKGGRVVAQRGGAKCPSP